MIDVCVIFIYNCYAVLKPVSGLYPILPVVIFMIQMLADRRSLRDKGIG